MAQTLLEITQGILSDMSGDTVNSIFDTEESEQVARIVVSTFNAIVSNSNWPQHKSLIQLVGSGDNTLPTHMTLPTGTKEVLFIKYDKIKSGEIRKAYENTSWKEQDEFLRMINSRDSTDSTIDTVVDASGVELLIRNDKAPTYYTSFDDTTIIFDSYDSDVESTLQGYKTQVAAYLQPTMALLDTEVPDLPVDAEAYLVETAMARAQSKIPEFRDVAAESESGRQRRSFARKGWKVNANRRYPDHGRKV